MPHRTLSPCWHASRPSSHGCRPGRVCSREVNNRCWPLPVGWWPDRCSSCSTSRPSVWPRLGVLAELREAGITVLLVDQRVDLALVVADRGYVLQHGRIVHEGSVADIHNDAALERTYLGEFD
jgi:hypothetical protein